MFYSFLYKNICCNKSWTWKQMSRNSLPSFHPFIWERSVRGLKTKFVYAAQIRAELQNNTPAENNFSLCTAILKLSNIFVGKMEENSEPPINYKTGTRVKCLDCECVGRLKTVNKEVILFPEKVLSTRSIRTTKEDLKKDKSYKETGPKKWNIAEQ